jgi:uncharacterized membrane protein
MPGRVEGKVAFLAGPARGRERGHRDQVHGQPEKMLKGAVAGAAGTTVLNAVGYGDMAVRGRPASSTPEQVVEQLARRSGLTIPGAGQERQSRLEGLGALTGMAAGVGVGVAAGLVPRAVRRLGPLAGPAAIGAAAMLATDLTIAVLGVSDPRTWDATSWLSDVVPHLAFGAVVYAALAEPPSGSAAPATTPPAAAHEDRQDSSAGRPQHGGSDPGEPAAAAPSPARPETPAPAQLGPAAALGAATGMRSTVALAALILRRNDGLPAAMRHPAARLAAAIAGASELVIDKLPMTPSRLEPPGLAGRVVSASLAAAVLARSGHQRPIPAMAMASAAALAAAKVCHDARATLARHLPDPAVAVAEDALAIGLATLGSRPHRPVRASTGRVMWFRRPGNQQGP